MSLGGPEIIVILIVALLVFGPHRLPDIGRQLGKAIREFRKIEQTVKTEISQALDLDSEPEAPDTRAPYYGDPTNVPDRPDETVAPERNEPGAVADADDHSPIPAAFLDAAADDATEPPSTADDTAPNDTAASDDDDSADDASDESAGTAGKADGDSTR
jgi:sec-independent protein translocase protein TatA